MTIVDLNGAAWSLTDEQVSALYGVYEICDYIGDEAMDCDPREAVYNSLMVIGPEESRDGEWHAGDPDSRIFSYRWDEEKKAWRKEER